MDIATLERRRAGLVTAKQNITKRVIAEGRDELTVTETVEFGALEGRIAEIDDTLQRSGYGNPGVEAARRAQASVGSDDGNGSWAARAATALQSMGGEARAITAGTIDVPNLVNPTVTPKARPTRLIDLLVSRKALTGNAFEYLVQSVRTNNAAVVADAAVKPTSVNTVLPVEDRARVVAHVSEPIPLRMFVDHEEITNFLKTEMSEGVLDALEVEIIAGIGTGEHMTGVLSTLATTAVPFSTDRITTLRKARTALQLIGETPNAVVLNPVDAEAVDLTRVSSGGETAVPAGFLLDGFQHGNAGSGNIFGGDDIQRIVSNSVPAGTAVLADWSKVTLFVRESVTIAVDAGGVLFTKNQAILRAEGRFGIGVTRPSAFAVIDLTP